MIPSKARVAPAPPSASRLDPVTHLPIRQQFFADYTKPAEARPAQANLVMVTLAEAGHFNALLRALGHEYSEHFIRGGAERIRAMVPQSIQIYHVSVLSLAFIYPSEPMPVIAALLDDWATPLLCAGIPIVTRLGIGMAECDDPSPAITLRNGLAAAQDSRRTATGWARYDSSTDRAHRRSFLLLSDLPAALAAPDQLALVFQPKYALATGQPTSAEALLRWDHPLLGPVPPAEFVPLTETTGLIGGLTQWVLNAGAGQAAAWRAAGLQLNMAINVSPQNLSEAGFAAKFAAILERHELDPRTIELEFTEGALASNDGVVRAELQRVRDLGVHVALDDFGTGFSNFSYIAHLPADIIKIDRAFIRLIDTDARSAELVRTLIQLAHRLDYRVVAEGVESEAAYRLLADWGCDEAQGYYLSRPLTPGNFRELMERQKMAGG